MSAAVIQPIAEVLEQNRTSAVVFQPIAEVFEQNRMCAVVIQPMTGTVKQNRSARFTKAATGAFGSRSLMGHSGAELVA